MMKEVKNIKNSNKDVKILRINKKKGEYYSFSKNEYIDVRDINLDDLKEIVDNIISSENSYTVQKYEQELMQDENSPNTIIYKILGQKIKELIKGKNELIKEIENDYSKFLENLKNPN